MDEKKEDTQSAPEVAFSQMYGKVSAEILNAVTEALKPLTERFIVVHCELGEGEEYNASKSMVHFLPWGLLSAGEHEEEGYGYNTGLYQLIRNELAVEEFMVVMLYSQDCVCWVMYNEMRSELCLGSTGKVTALEEAFTQMLNDCGLEEVSESYSWITLKHIDIADTFSLRTDHNDTINEILRKETQDELPQ